MILPLGAEEPPLDDEELLELELLFDDEEELLELELLLDDEELLELEPLPDWSTCIL